MTEGVLQRAELPQSANADSPLNEGAEKGELPRYPLHRGAETGRRGADPYRVVCDTVGRGLAPAVLAFPFGEGVNEVDG